MIVLKLRVGMPDAKGKFLQGQFSNDEHDTRMMILDGNKNKHPENVLLKLLAPICGLKNAAMDFWIKLVKAFRKLGRARSRANK